ncbi:LytTR family transcriptional regulator DNA-binding domain-containing protein [Paenibacillus oenotherae]|uniref:LytTR family transcriptional regulator DNA-binding domain-containing protein n=1 Tax=Paenibacillus oenotherae TaxID=1435645 RepID=A0ABS7D2L3_9BACL|nr:LytTR family transcriptional regulator DNA-binding domain-containing protein [Paenibacillus oenotherae]MBW7473817.1 LytTR family transcriptional regulator DNA-binding domain-containing protein [Paenibacillus oenotherae]
MMKVGMEGKSLYESFEVQKDIYYFKVGRLGTVSFHGRNYNIRRNISADQLKSYLADGHFVKISSRCYINLNKVLSLTDGMLHFAQDGTYPKQLPISKWKQQHIRNLLSARKSIAM